MQSNTISSCEAPSHDSSLATSPGLLNVPTYPFAPNTRPRGQSGSWCCNPSLGRNEARSHTSRHTLCGEKVSLRGHESEGHEAWTLFQTYSATFLRARCSRSLLLWSLQNCPVGYAGRRVVRCPVYHIRSIRRCTFCFESLGGLWVSSSTRTEGFLCSFRSRT